MWIHIESTWKQRSQYLVASTVQFQFCKLISAYIFICNVRDNKAHDARQWYVLFDIGSKSIETSCSSSSAALEGEQSKDTSQNRNLSIVGIGIGESLPLQFRILVCILFKLVVSRTSASAMI